MESKTASIGRATAVMAASVLLALGSVTWAVSNKEKASDQRFKDRPIEVLTGGYVSSRACKSCHPHEYATWYSTYHRTMTQSANPQSVRAPFDGRKLELHGQIYRVNRRGDQFWADMPGQDGARIQKQIAMITGSHHMQIYWFPSGQSRKVEQFPFVYLLGEERWVPQKTHFVMVPSRRVSTEPGSWNTSCIKCHVTLGRPRYTNREDIDSLAVEFGIACEACHGPGEDHVRQYRSLQDRSAKAPAGIPGNRFEITHPAKLPHRRSSQVCGQCHGIFTFKNIEDGLLWNAHGFPYRPGDDLHEKRFYIREADRQHPIMQNFLKANPTFMEESFWSDGMVRVSGREYNGLLESPCYRRGELTCLSCHTLHKPADDPRPLQQWANDLLKRDMETNRACLQCHDSIGSRIEQHTRHRVGSAGRQCTNCHMPYTTYGLLKAIRSHQINSPTVSDSLRTGRPNACNQCHLDRTLDWAATHLEEWYQIPKPSLSADQRSVAASLLWLLSGDAGQRALMAWSLGWEPARQASGTGWMAPYLAQLLVDPYDAVRFLAHRSLRTLPSFQGFRYDFVASPSQRRAAKAQAGRIWSQKPIEERAVGASTLISSQGRLKEDVFRRLLRQRDDRPVNLAE